MQLINVNCYNCHSNEYKLYDRENGYNLVKCSNCGLLYVNPRPIDDEITLAHRVGIHRGEQELHSTNPFNDIMIQRYQKILTDFYNPLELYNKTWLDIGCGNGEFLVALRAFTGNRLQIKGSEPNTLKVQTARDHKLNVNFIDLGRHDDKYDFVSFLNVYSHLPNPIEALNNWKRLIKKDGEIFIETGHSCHLPSRYHFKPYLIPDHLSFANKKILISILSKSGFKILKLKIYRGNYYPPFTPINISKEFAKMIIGRNNHFHSFIPEYRHGDMFIRAKKI
jgi:2-polyprenyl-3-methyl-5-hydroxy-6-metoxy-1,4-benzoquinol methylase